MDFKKKDRALKKFYTLPNKAVGQSYRIKINKLISLLNKKK